MFLKVWFDSWHLLHAFFCFSEFSLLDIELCLSQVCPAVARVMSDKSIALFVSPCDPVDGGILLINAWRYLLLTRWASERVKNWLGVRIYGLLLSILFDGWRYWLRGWLDLWWGLGYSCGLFNNWLLNLRRLLLNQRRGLLHLWRLLLSLSLLNRWVLRYFDFFWNLLWYFNWLLRMNRWFLNRWRRFSLGCGRTLSHALLWRRRVFLLFSRLNTELW